jgi:polygalacturonase
MMNIKIRRFCFFILLFVFHAATAQTFNILEYGAVGDGKTLNTLAVQKAIDACYLNGGGKVVIPTGIFITGTFNLKSHVNMYLETGAILRGSPNLIDYTPYNSVHYGMIYTKDAEDITISGSGNIDGNGDQFFELDKSKSIPWEIRKYTRQKENYRKVEGTGVGDGPVVPKDRPYQMIIFSNCKRVTIKDVLITQPALWAIHFADCDGVQVDGIRLWTNMLAPNADGIDITSCNNVVVSNSDIRSGDDCLVITGYDNHLELPGFIRVRHPSENFIISNCNLQSCSSAIRIGSIDQNSVHNINISNCNISNSTRGIGIFLRDEGSLEDIIISNVIIETKLRTGDWWGNGEPIHISAVRGKEKVKLGKIRNIKFDDITCKSENGILLYGSEESVIENVSFHNLTLDIIDSKLNDVEGGNIDLRGCLLEKQLFEHDLPGFLAMYVKDLTINEFELVWSGTRMPWFTHGIEVDNFTGLRIKDFKGTASPLNPKAFPVFLLNGVGADVDQKIHSEKREVK